MSTRRLVSQFGTFVIIGGTATCIHAAIVVASVERLGISPVAANVVAFLAANIVSYIANGRITFRKKGSWTIYLRFIGVSLLTLAVVTGISAVCEAWDISYLISLALILLVVPPISFMLIKTFAFS